ncbi:MAG: hypothetical protein AAF518_25100 [Spirochaetota bacterium]
MIETGLVLSELIWQEIASHRSSIIVDFGCKYPELLEKLCSHSTVKRYTGICANHKHRDWLLGKISWQKKRYTLGKKVELGLGSLLYRNANWSTHENILVTTSLHNSEPEKRNLFGENLFSIINPQFVLYVPFPNNEPDIAKMWLEFMAKSYSYDLQGKLSQDKHYVFTLEKQWK